MECEVEPTPTRGSTSRVIRSVEIDAVLQMTGQLLTALAEAEAASYLRAHARARDRKGRRLVVRNGSTAPRTLQTEVGSVRVRVPRINDRRIVAGRRQRFVSRLFPPYVRRPVGFARVLPRLCLRALANDGDGTAALSTWLGVWEHRNLSDCRYEYLRAEPLQLAAANGVAQLSLLVLLGLSPGGIDELLAVAPAPRRDAASWHELLASVAARGLAEPRLIVGDGSPALSLAIRDVWPAARQLHGWNSIEDLTQVGIPAGHRRALVPGETIESASVSAQVRLSDARTKRSGSAA